MTEETKNLLNEIKECLSNGEFETASDLCVSFVEKFPNCFNGWAYYIMANCRTRNVQELVDSDYALQDVSVYTDAIKTLDEAERKKLLAWKEKIEHAKGKSGASGDPCIAYFYKCLRKLKAEIVELKEKRNQYIEDDKAELKEIKRGSSSFFSGNLIYFFVLCSIIALPFVFLYVFMEQSGTFWMLKILPLIAAGVIVVFIALRKLKKQKSYKKEFISRKESCDGNAAEIFALQIETNEKTTCFKKLKAIYNKVKKKDVLSEKLRIQYRRKFDGIYNEFAVKKEQ